MDRKNGLNDQVLSLPGDHRELEPPDPIPNSVVKRFIADGSVEFLHVRVGHRQALITSPIRSPGWGFFMPERCGPGPAHRQGRARPRLITSPIRSPGWGFFMPERCGPGPAHRQGRARPRLITSPIRSPKWGFFCPGVRDLRANRPFQEVDDSLDEVGSDIFEQGGVI